MANDGRITGRIRASGQRTVARGHVVWGYCYRGGAGEPNGVESLTIGLRS